MDMILYIDLLSQYMNLDINTTHKINSDNVVIKLVRVMVIVLCLIHQDFPVGLV